MDSNKIMTFYRTVFKRCNMYVCINNIQHFGFKLSRPNIEVCPCSSFCSWCFSSIKLFMSHFKHFHSYNTFYDHEHPRVNLSWSSPHFFFFSSSTSIPPHFLHQLQSPITQLVKASLDHRSAHTFRSSPTFGTRPRWMVNFLNPIPHVLGPEVPSLTLHPHTCRMGLGVCSINFLLFLSMSVEHIELFIFIYY